MLDELDFGKPDIQESLDNVWMLMIDQGQFGVFDPDNDSRDTMVAPNAYPTFENSSAFLSDATSPMFTPHLYTSQGQNQTPYFSGPNCMLGFDMTNTFQQGYPGSGTTTVTQQTQRDSSAHPNAGADWDLSQPIHGAMGVVDPWLSDYYCPSALASDISMTPSTLPDWLSGRMPVFLPVGESGTYATPQGYPENLWIHTTQGQNQTSATTGGWTMGAAQHDYESQDSARLAEPQANTACRCTPVYCDGAPANCTPSTPQQSLQANPQLVRRLGALNKPAQPRTRGKAKNENAEGTPSHQDVKSVQGSKSIPEETLETDLLQSTLVPSPYTAGPKSKARFTLAPTSTGRGQKRAKEDEEGSEGRPKKVPKTVRKRPSKPKQQPRVKAIRNSDQLLPKSHGGDDAGRAHQQHAESEPCLSGIPQGKKTRIGASQQASTTASDDANTPELLIPEPDWNSPKIVELLSKSWDLKSLGKGLPFYIPCHWGYDGTKPLCGEVFADRREVAIHMEKAHQRGDKTLPWAMVEMGCLWPGCSWRGQADQLIKCHMTKASHTHVLTRYLRLECDACQASPMETLEHWSQNGGRPDGHDRKPYLEHAKMCTGDHNGKWRVRRVPSGSVESGGKTREG